MLWKLRHSLILLSFMCCFAVWAQKPAKSGKGLVLRKTIKGGISPKSIVHSGTGLFFAQNMMYRHTVSVYNRKYQLVKTIKDEVRPSQFGQNAYPHSYKGAPVEACFTQNGKTAWVTNYQMHGKGFNKPGKDNCKTSGKYDKSFVYKINTATLAIEGIAPTGCVPKFIAATPDGCSLLASNWCSGDLSLIDAGNLTETKRIAVGRYPRGIAVNPKGTIAYVAAMGANQIVAIDLGNRKPLYKKYVGRTPRHLCIGPNGRYLYITLNGEGKVAKMDVYSRKIVAKTATGRAPRSMAMTADGNYLYVVNYLANTLSKVRTADMKVLKSVKTNGKPIGVTIDDAESKIWVACYTGSIMVFEDLDYQAAPLLPIPDGENEMVLNEIAGYDSAPLPPLNAPASPPEVEMATKTVQAQPPTQPSPRAGKKPAKSGKSAPPAAKPQTAKKSAKPAAKGTAKKQQKPPAKPSQKTKTSAAKGPYYLIAGSFDSFDAAMKFTVQLNGKGYKSAAVVKGKGKPYRVCYASYPTRAGANAHAKALKAKGIKTWIYAQ